MKKINNDKIISDNPKSLLSESIKTIRTNLAFANLNNKMQVILITSPTSGDGKSFISANLAAAYSEENKKVLLIDCDLRRGRQHHIFNIINSPTGGYSNLIYNYNSEDYTFEEKIRDYILKTSYKNLYVLPTGPTPPNPVELLASNNNKELIKKLRTMFDIIVLDCPPAVGLSDSLILSKLSDANVVVITSHRTRSELLEQTIKNFEQVGSQITGVVINNVTIKKNSYYGYYTKDYYSENKVK